MKWWGLKGIRLLTLRSFLLCLDLFRLKYEDKWLPMYELAKTSLNNRGNEIKSCERRSSELREQNPSTVLNVVGHSEMSENIVQDNVNGDSEYEQNEFQ